MFSEHNAMRLEINPKEKKPKNSRHMEPKQWITEEIKRKKKKKSQKQMTMKAQVSKTYAVKAVLRGKFIIIQNYLREKKISNKLPNLTPKANRERRISKIQSQ